MRIGNFHGGLQNYAIQTECKVMYYRYHIHHFITFFIEYQIFCRKIFQVGKVKVSTSVSQVIFFLTKYVKVMAFILFQVHTLNKC